MLELRTNDPEIDDRRIRRLRKSEYEQLVNAGVFGDEKLELIRGVIVRMTPQGVPHSSPIRRLTMLLAPKLAGRADVLVQLPLDGPDDSQPEPDLAVIPHDAPEDRHPTSALLVVEVAASSLRYDRVTKAPLYAEMGVSEYWIVDVEARAIERHTEPARGHYARVVTYRAGESITLHAFADVTLAVTDVVR